MLTTTNKKLIAVLAFLASAVSFLSPIQSAYYQGDKTTLAVYALVVLAVTAFVYLIPAKGTKNSLFSKEVFQGLGKLTSESSIPRKRDADNLANLVRSKGCDPIIVVGKSGVGKSILVTKQVVPQLANDSFECVYIDNYRIANNGLKSILYEQLLPHSDCLDEDDFFDTADFVPSAKRDLLLVFDQFEQFLFQCTGDTSGSVVIRDWLKLLIKNLVKQDNIKIVIVVRKEWYYDLRFLDFIPSPADAFHVNGIAGDNKIGTSKIHSSIGQAVDNDEFAEEIVADLYNDNEILPIEVQMVGFVLENEAKRSRKIDSEWYRSIGRKNGLIQKFFKSYIEASPNKEVALKVLFSMSVETHLRTQHSYSAIAQTVHERDSDVKECLQFFLHEGVVKKRNNGEYELAHDFLAEKFHKISATEMDPITRDNISVFYDCVNKSDDIKLTRPVDKRSLLISDCVLFFLIVLTAFRLIAPLYPASLFNFIESFNPIQGALTQTSWIDTTYFPAFFSHAFWFWYVTSLYKNLLFHIDNDLLSKFTVVNCACCVVAATVWPNWFIVSIGWGGFIVGVKYFSLYRTPQLGQSSKAILFRIAATTIANSVFVMIAGLVFALYIQGLESPEKLYAYWTIGGYSTALFLAYFAIAVSQEHITKEAGAKLMGLIDRAKLNGFSTNI